MMGIFSTLFSSSATTEKIVDGVVAGVDSMFYTDEEKSVANQKILDFKLEYAKTTQGQNIARRVIAFAVTFLFVLLCLTIVTAKGFGYDDYSEFAYKFMTDVIAMPFSIIIGFYFAASLVRK